MNKAIILKQILEERKSTFPKDYTDKEIPQHIIDDVLSAAVLAPNHKRTRPWRFRVFKKEEKRKLGEELQQIYKTLHSGPQFLQKKYDDILFKIMSADTVISIVVDFSGLVPEWEEIAATAMGVQNMYLTCAANNIGCYWSSPKLVNHLKEALQTGENQKCLGLFYMGNIT